MTFTANRPRKPDFAIIGAQKAGTSTLSAILAQIPTVTIPRGESPQYESPYFEQGGSRGLQYELGALAKPDHLVGIKRPNYLPSTLVPGRLHQDLPQAHVLCVLRHPSQRAFSAYLHYAEYNLVPRMYPNEALDKLLDGDNLGSQRSYEILDWGIYAYHLQAWERTFGDRLHILKQDDLVSSPAQELARLPFLTGHDLSGVTSVRMNEGVKSMRELRARAVMHHSLTPA